MDTIILNDYQKAVLRDYADGDFAYLADIGSIDNPMDLGDLMLSFLMVELSDKEDCDSLDVASDRLVTAKTDIEVALSAIEKLQKAIQLKMLESSIKVVNG